MQLGPFGSSNVCNCMCACVCVSVCAAACAILTFTEIVHCAGLCKKFCVVRIAHSRIARAIVCDGSLLAGLWIAWAAGQIHTQLQLWLP